MGNRRKPQNPTYGPTVWMHAATALQEAEAKADELMTTLEPGDLRDMLAHLLCLSSAFGSRWTDTERAALTKDIQTATLARRKLERG